MEEAEKEEKVAGASEAVAQEAAATAEGDVVEAVMDQAEMAMVAKAAAGSEGEELVATEMEAVVAAAEAEVRTTRSRPQTAGSDRCSHHRCLLRCCHTLQMSHQQRRRRIGRRTGCPWTPARLSTR